MSKNRSGKEKRLLKKRAVRKAYRARKRARLRMGALAQP